MALNSILKNQRPSLVFGLPLVIQRRDRDKTNRGHQPVASPEMNIANRQLTVMALNRNQVTTQGDMPCKHADHD